MHLAGRNVIWILSDLWINFLTFKIRELCLLVIQIDQKNHLSSIFCYHFAFKWQSFWVSLCVTMAEFHFRSLFMICRPDDVISTSERVWAHCVVYASPCKQYRLGHAVNWIILIFCYIVHETSQLYSATMCTKLLQVNKSNSVNAA